MPITPHRINTATLSPNKIYVGNRQLFTSIPVIQRNGTLYLPATEIEQALCFSLPKNYVTVIDGGRYTTTDALMQSGATTSAAFDSLTQRINIAPDLNRGDNLLSWGGNDVHSKWAKVTPWKTTLVTRSSGTEYRLLSGKKNTGCQTRLTDQVRQYGSGTYRLTIDLRTQAETKVKLVFGLNSVEQIVQADANSTQWTTVTVDFTVANVTAEEDVINAYLRILQTEDDCYLRFKNAKLEYIS